MLDHPVTQTADESIVTALVLVGPPASGKTTIRDICADYGVIGCDLAQARDEHAAVQSALSQSLIETTIAEASDPPLCCIEGAIDEDEVNYIRKLADATVVVFVTVPDKFERIERYVDRELDPNVSTREDQDLAEWEAFRRERSEQPYPSHDVRIVNEDDLSISELTTRCGHLLAALSNHSSSQFDTPADMGDV